MPFGTLLLVGLGLVAGSQDEPQIRHTALQCLPDSQYAQVDAVIVPGPEIQTAKVYFRSDQYPDFYYVEMKGTTEDSFQGVLPKPSPETEHVIYYVEAISHSFSSARTAEHDPEVGTENECERRNGRAPLFMGSAPRIIIGAVKAGAPAVPPGFQAAGIVGFVSAAGVASGTAGGGIGVGTAVVVGAAGAGAAGVAVAASGGDSDSSGSASSGSPPSSTTTTTAVAATTSTTTSSTTTTAFNEAPKACVVTTPVAPVVTEGDVIKFDASCSAGDRLQEDTVASYNWDLGDGRTRSGRVISVAYDRAGIYTVTLTVTDQAGLQDVFRVQVTVNARFTPPVACFTATDLGLGCKIVFDASCSTGVIDKYDWILDTTAVFPGSPVSTSGQIITQDFGFSCFGQTITAQLKVTGADGSVNVTSQAVLVQYLTNPFQQSLELESSMGAFLGVRPFDGAAKADIVVNGVRVGGVDSAGATDARFRGRPGVNTIEATSDADKEGLLRLDFSGAAHFVPGSIKIEYGTVISLDDRTVVFRLNGAPGERLKLTYQLLP